MGIVMKFLQKMNILKQVHCNYFFKISKHTKNN